MSARSSRASEASTSASNGRDVARWQVEIDPYCRRVLESHFPECLSDSKMSARSAPQDLAPVDVICGGFPCQDLSLAGQGAGIDGARSGLWSEFARIIRELRPRYVVVENVPALLTGRGLGTEFSGTWPRAGMTRSGTAYRLRAFGAPHRRDRIWIVAYPARDVPKRGQRQRQGPSGNEFGRAVLRAERERFPTPTATDARKGYSSPRARRTLAAGGRFRARSSRDSGRRRRRPQRPRRRRVARAKSGGDDLVTAFRGRRCGRRRTRRTGKGGRISPDAVILSGRRPSGAKAQRTLREAIRKKDLASDSPPPRAGALNPTWVEWLMGFPIGWTALRPSETPSSHKSRSGSGGGSSTTRRKSPAAKRRSGKALRRKDGADG